MSILTKPYKLSVWRDTLVNGSLQEEQICVIGSDSMTSQCAALEPTFVRNVNGQKKLSFKMYKHYIDNITGEKVDNLFTDLLKNETKVKLYYEDQWHDFVVKNIVENSTNYQYTYQLEDALVQELSKNGFNITLDPARMNNMDTAKKLAEEVLKETDWTVESEVLVEKVEEALVYIQLPSSLTSYKIYRLNDQQSPYTNGVTSTLLTESTTPKLSSLQGKTALAFYSSCTSKPHRFQFIYSSNGYGKDANGAYKISRKDDRVIDEANCQYYIDFQSEESYAEPSEETNGNGARAWGLYLPANFKIGVPGSHVNNPQGDKDSTLRAWYRGKRYGFSQQAVYVPLLDRYCQKFDRNEVADVKGKWKIHNSATTGTFTWDKDKRSYKIVGKTTDKWGGYRLDYAYYPGDTYIVDYTLKVTDGTLNTIGGHNAGFTTKFYVNDQEVSQSDTYALPSPVTPNNSITVHAEYSNYNAKVKQPEIYLQPNRGSNTAVEYEISNLTVTVKGPYLGYSESQFVSPTFVQNYITNYNFESKSGWIATAASQEDSSTKPQVVNICGRFDNSGTFHSLIDDYKEGEYDSENTYTSYMKMTFFGNTQFVLNSGLKDNRSRIGNLAEGEEWVIDYQAVDAENNEVSDFDFELGEYIYDIATGGYKTRSGFLEFDTRSPQEKEIPQGKTIV